MCRSFAITFFVLSQKFWLDLEGAAHIKDVARVPILRAKVDRELLVPLHINAFMHQVFHPTGLQSIALLRVGVLEGLRCLLSIHVFSIDSDPAVVLAQQTIR